MSADDTGPVDAARKWLRSTGYPLEMRVARDLALVATEVQQSRHYLAFDGPTPTPREVDVVAVDVVVRGAANDRTKPRVELVYVVECKASRKKPWVAFVGESRFTSHLDLIGTLTVERASGATEPTWPRYFDSGPLWTSEHTAYAVATAFSASPDQGDDKRELAYAAIQQVLSGVEGLAAEFVDEQPTIRIFVPIVVTSAPLVTCRLQGDEEILEEVDQVLYVSGTGTTRQLQSVWILRDTAVESFAKTMKSTSERLRRG